MSNRFLQVADLAEFHARNAFIAAEMGYPAWQGDPIVNYQGYLYVQVPPESTLYAQALESVPVPPGINSYISRMPNGVFETPTLSEYGPIEMIQADSLNLPLVKVSHLDRMLGLSQIGGDASAISAFITATNWQEPANPIGWVLELEYGGAIRIRPIYDMVHRYEVIRGLFQADPKTEAIYVVSESDANMAYEMLKQLNQAGATWDLSRIVWLIQAKINPNWQPS